MLIVSQMHGFNAAVAKKPLAVAYQDYKTNTTPATTFNFASTGIGAAAADRRVIVGVIANTNSTSYSTWHEVQSLSVGGIAATKLFAVNANRPSGGYFARLEFWYADVPTGTTATVSVTANNPLQRCTIATWTTESRATLHDTLSSSANPMTGSLNFMAGGIGIGMTFIDSNNTMTWTNLTERFDTAGEGDIRHSGADTTSSSTQTLTITATPSVSGTERVMAAISLKP